MLVLDAGAFLAVERADRTVLALLKGELTQGRVPRTSAAVVAQVWRGGRDRQVHGDLAVLSAHADLHVDLVQV